MLTSFNWIIVWLRFELNLLSFLPLISRGGNNSSTSSSVKYFLIQAIGRIILLISFRGIFSSFEFPFREYIIFLIRIILKMGIAPFHFWFPSVVNNLSYGNIIVILSLQKIGPIFLIVFFLNIIRRFLLLLICSVTSLVGGVGGLNQTRFRGIISYRRIGHLGWIFCLINISIFVPFFYFLFYCFIVLYIVFFLYYFRIKKLFSMEKVFSLRSGKFYIIFRLLSLGGIPPILGFFPKWLIFSLIGNSILIFILILGSLINLFFYLSVRFSNLTQRKIFYKFKRNFFFFFFVNLFLPLLLLF